MTAAMRGDRTAAAALEETEAWLAVGVRALASLYNPQMIVFAGYLEDVVDHLGDELALVVRRNMLPSAAAVLSITTGSLGDNAVLIGAAERTLLRPSSSSISSPDVGGPGTLEELRAYFHLTFPMHSWNADEPEADGSVAFSCGCGETWGPYPSEELGEVAIEAEHQATAAGWRAYVTAWAERHRDLAPEGSSFFMLMGCGPDQGPDGGLVWREDNFPRQGVFSETDPPQRGLAEVVLSRQGLAGALTVPLSVLTERLGLRTERSFINRERLRDRLSRDRAGRVTLVHWHDSDYVEVDAKTDLDRPWHSRSCRARALPRLRRTLVGRRALPAPAQPSAHEVAAGHPALRARG